MRTGGYVRRRQCACRREACLLVCARARMCACPGVQNAFYEHYVKVVGSKFFFSNGEAVDTYTYTCSVEIQRGRGPRAPRLHRTHGRTHVQGWSTSPHLRATYVFLAHGARFFL